MGGPTFVLPMFENLSDRFEKAFQRIRGEATITEANIGETAKEIRGFCWVPFVWVVLGSVRVG